MLKLLTRKAPEACKQDVTVHHVSALVQSLEVELKLEAKKWNSRLTDHSKVFLLLFLLTQSLSLMSFSSVFLSFFLFPPSGKISHSSVLQEEEKKLSKKTYTYDHDIVCALDRLSTTVSGADEILKHST